MESLCSTCLSRGRKLYCIGDLEPVLQSLAPELQHVRTTQNICWECKAVLKKFTSFRDQLLQAHTLMFNQSLEQDRKGKACEPRNNTLSTLTTKHNPYLDYIFQSVNDNVGSEIDTNDSEDLMIDVECADNESVTYNQDANNEPVTYNYDTNNEPVTYNYDANNELVTYNRDANNALVTYNYDANNELVTYNRNANNELVTYNYNANNELVTYNYDANNELVTYNYDANNEKVINNHDANNKLMTYNYDANNEIVINNHGANNKLVTYNYDANNEIVINNHDANNKLVTYNYDANNEIVINNHDANNKLVTYNYDANNEIVINNHDANNESVIDYHDANNENMIPPTATEPEKTLDLMYLNNVSKAPSFDEKVASVIDKLASENKNEAGFEVVVPPTATEPKKVLKMKILKINRNVPMLDGKVNSVTDYLVTEDNDAENEKIIPPAPKKPTKVLKLLYWNAFPNVPLFDRNDKSVNDRLVPGNDKNDADNEKTIPLTATEPLKVKLLRMQQNLPFDEKVKSLNNHSDYEHYNNEPVNDINDVMMINNYDVNNEFAIDNYDAYNEIVIPPTATKANKVLEAKLVKTNRNLPLFDNDSSDSEIDIDSDNVIVSDIDDADNEIMIPHTVTEPKRVLRKLKLVKIIPNVPFYDMRWKSFNKFVSKNDNDDVVNEIVIPPTATEPKKVLKVNLVRINVPLFDGKGNLLINNLQANMTKADIKTMATNMKAKIIKSNLQPETSDSDIEENMTLSDLKKSTKKTLKKVVTKRNKSIKVPVTVKKPTKKSLTKVVEKKKYIKRVFPKDYVPQDSDVIELFDNNLRRVLNPSDYATVTIRIMNAEELKQYREYLKFEPNYKSSNYKCDLCIIGFYNLQQLKDHNIFKHERGTRMQNLLCPICKSYISRGLYVFHYGRHVAYYTCKLCPQRMADIRELRSHLPKHRDVITYNCEKCAMQFKTSYHLRMHKNRRHGEPMVFVRPKRVKRNTPKEKSSRSYDCVLCEYKFQSRLRMRQHIQAVHRTKGHKYHCNRCDVICNSLVSFQKHFRYTRAHITDSPGKVKFVCSYCGKAFTANFVMQEHINFVHKGKTDYVCHICNKMLSSKGSLTKHIKSVHEGVKQAKDRACNVCGKFYNAATLRSHVRIHSDARPYICKICGDTFKQTGSLYTHMRLKHKRRNPPAASLNLATAGTSKNPLP